MRRTNDWRTFADYGEGNPSAVPCCALLDGLIHFCPLTSPSYIESGLN
jgi:hypothetical protein